MIIFFRIAILLLIFTLTINYEIKSYVKDEIKNFYFHEIIEDDINRISNLMSFTPINDSIVLITDAGSRCAHFININGDFINLICPPLIFADSIAANKIAFSKYRGEHYRFLFLNEITYPPSSPNAGKIFPDSLIEKFIKRNYINCSVVNDSIICIIATYEMYVQDMNPNEKIFSRGKEDTPILVFYNYKTNLIENIEYYQQQSNLFPRTYTVKFNHKDNQIFSIVQNANKGISPDKIPFVVSYNGAKGFNIHKYFPLKLYKYINSLDLLSPSILFVDDKMFCVFRLLNEVYNLTDNSTFIVQNLNNDNIDFLDSFNISNPSFEKINFTICYFGLLKNKNILLIIDCKKENDEHEFQIQEYSLLGNLIKSKSISKTNHEVGNIISLVSLDNNNLIFGISYNDENEKYNILRFEW